MTDIYYIDLSEIYDREALYEKLFKILPLPEYCGRNLDALYDVFTGEFSDCRLFFSGAKLLEENLSGYGSMLRTMCQEAAENNPGLEIFFL